MNYYLISPKVDGKTTGWFLDKMFERHIVMMGWGTDNPIGEQFNNLSQGDFVIVAQRVNWVFNYFFAAIIDDDCAFTDEEGPYQCRKLRCFVDLRDSKTNLLDGVSFYSAQTIRALTAIYDENVITRLESLILQQSQMEDIITLLTNNHNLILTGAPGTGKTFLAKQIAAQMILGHEYDESNNDDKAAMETQCGFVQFHPSYDYTDFVEGLRPKEDENGNIGFERRDGVFKEFCAKALENYLSSKKKKEQLEKEATAQMRLVAFIDDAIENETEFHTPGTRNAFRLIEDRKRSILVEIPNNERTNRLSVPKSDILALLESEDNISGGKDVQEFFHRKYRTQQDSYIYAIYKAVTESAYSETVDIEEVKEKPYIFIIDEINRGEISKIFGELFFSIDPGYRGEDGKVKTQYQNLIDADDVFADGFYVPDNVYIIGTMNDIDRSVESMDFAMRRRFAFKEISASETAENIIKSCSDLINYFKDIKDRMDNLNNCIVGVGGLSSAYQIGAAYFLKLKNYLKEDGQPDWDSLWHNHLKGLLFEYLRGLPNAADDLNKLYDAFNLRPPL